MKILIVSMDNSKKTKIGGKHIHQELFEKGLIMNGHSVDFAYPNLTGYSNLTRRVKNKLKSKFNLISGLDLYKQHVGNIINILTEDIEQKLKHNNYDYISAQDALAAYIVIKVLENKNVKIPVYLTLHGYFARECLNYGYFKSNEIEDTYKFAMTIEKYAVSKSDGIITVDTRIKEYVEAEFKIKNNIKVIFNAIDNERFVYTNSQQKIEIREKLGLPQDKKLLLVARRLVKKNGVKYTLKAMKKLIDLKEHNYYLCIVGDGPEKNNLIEYIEENKLQNYVKFCGAIDHKEVDKYYKSADYILMPSIKSDDIEEATSLSMLEGMACGKVVIASSIGGMKEVIRHEENGILVEEKNENQIVEVLIQLSENPEIVQSIATNASEYIQEKHSYVNHAKEFVDYFLRK